MPIGRAGGRPGRRDRGRRDGHLEQVLVLALRPDTTARPPSTSAIVSPWSCSGQPSRAWPRGRAVVRRWA